MSYNMDMLSQQLQDIQRKYQQLSNMQGQTQLFPNQSQSISVPQQPVIPKQIQYVEGFAGARLYQNNLPPNSSEIILDKNDDILYKVSKDANGTPSKKIVGGKFTIIEEPVEEEPVFLTRKDLDNFKEEMKQLIKQNNSPINPKGGTDK